MRIFLLILLTAMQFINLFAQQPINHNSVVEINEHDVQFEPNKIIIKLHEQFAFIDLSAEGAGVSNTIIPALAQLNQEYRVKSIKKLFPFVRKINLQPNDLTTIYEVEYEHEISPIELSTKYAALPEIEFAEPDYIASILVNPNDPYYQDGSQWYHDDVKAPQAWQLTTGDASQIIGIIDTGVDWEHEDLKDNIWVNVAERDGTTGVDDDNNGFVDDIRGWDFVNDDNNPKDDNSHGTHVAGIAGAKTNNDIGIAGISWNSKLMAIKVMQSSGRGSWSDIAQGAAYAAENGTTVINMSLGGYTESLTMKTTLENAYHYSVLVAAAGNDGLCIVQECMVSAAMFPAVYPWVLGVQASQSSPGMCGIRACWSNHDPSGPTSFTNQYGYNYEVLAPGSNIYSTIPGNGYRYLSGTSMATPITSGAVALIKSYLPNISTEELFARIIQASGSGVLNIEGAMKIQLIPDVRLESFTIVDTLAGCDRDGRADAGETVLINVKVKNYGGWAQNVKAELKLGEFEDKSVTVFIDSISSLHNISSYAQVNNNDNPFKISIPESIANNRDIVFSIKTKADNWLITNSKNQTVTIENGIEFSGIFEGKITLSANKYYIVNDPFVCDTLILEPGATLRISDRIYVNEWLEANGKPDSLVIFLPNGDVYWETVNSKIFSDTQLYKRYLFEYCFFYKTKADYSRSYLVGTFENSIFKMNHDKFSMMAIIKNSIITESSSLNNSYDTKEVLNSLFINNKKHPYSLTGYLMRFNTLLGYFKNNSIFNNYEVQNKNSNNNQVGIAQKLPWKNYILPANYLGTLNKNKFRDLIVDFEDFGELSPLLDNKLQTKPPLDAHGHVWQVLVNNVNPYDDVFEPVGSESVKFDVYFNRAMDTNFTPFLSFGVREPYTQKVVIDSARWISWKQDENLGDTYYHLQVSDKSDFSNLIIDKNDILDLNYKYDLNGNSEYFWKVRYKNGINGDWDEWSEVKSFKTKETRKAKVPNITYPINNDSTNNAFFLLIEEDLFVQRYFYQLATDENFSNIINSDTITNNKKYLQSLVAGQSYYLRAKTFNTFGISEFSSIVKFKVRSSNNYAAPDLLTPINNDTTYNITNRIFKWTNVPWAVKYQFQIGTSTAFTGLTYESFVTDTFVKFFENLSLGIKYWRVKAINGSIESPWSQVYKYTIPTKTVNISLDSIFTYNLMTYNGSGLDSNEIAILPDGTYYWRFGTESTFYTFEVTNKKCQTNIPIDKAKWMDTNVTFRWNNGPKANTLYNARWQAYHTMDFTTGDGLQMIRVAGAKDNEGFEIPIEWNRFQFEVQATAALSNDFIAEGKVGKIDLEWGMPDVERDILGFNLYRFKKKTLTTWGDTVKVNNILIVDSTYSDYNIIPDSTYYYVYRIVRTTLDEGEDSRMVSASAYPTILEAPTLLYPPNDTTKLPVNIAFDWDEPSGATNYIIQIAKDANFTDILINENVEVSNYLSTTLNNRTKYYWRVKAEGIQGTSAWSQVRNFTTIPILPAVPTLEFPTNNSISQPLSMTFNWANANEADSYHLQISDDEFFGNLVKDLTNLLSSQSYVSNLAINKTYYWRVRSRNVAGFSNWSSKWLFTTDTAGAAQPPSSWNFADNTGNSSIIVVPKNINPIINGRAILPGDAIGIFYKDEGNSKCAGYGIWEGNNLAITVWGDDDQTPAKDGFLEDEDYKIRLWDSRAEKEFIGDFSVSSGKDYYTINGYTVLGNLITATEESQNIYLAKSWNLISSYIIANNDSLENIFKEVGDNLVIMKELNGNVYIPSYEINTIGKWDYRKGYQAYLSNNDTLSILGIATKPNQEKIYLNSGWTYISYLRKTALGIENCLESLTETNSLIIAKNSKGQVYIPAYAINTIGDMLPGQGYQVYLNKTDTLIYPANSLGKNSNTKTSPVAKYLESEYSNTGSNSTIVIKINAKDEDEIGVYNSEGKLVGSGAVYNGVAAITVWGDNEQTEAIDGAIVNDELRFKNYDINSGLLNEVESILISDTKGTSFVNSIPYKKDGITVAEIRLEEKASDLFLEINPNPASTTFDISYKLGNANICSIKIYNNKGGLVDEITNLNDNKYTYNSNKLSSGTYTVILNCDDQVLMRKLIIVK